MAHSIESRIPFLDFRLVEFIASLPASFKIQEGLSKFILRQAMKDAIPPTVFSRTDKIGFATAEEIWMKQHSHFFRELLRRTIEDSGGFIGPRALEEFDLMIAGKSPFRHHHWRLICYGLWVQAFQVV